jgi:hypothetical protein
LLALLAGIGPDYGRKNGFAAARSSIVAMGGSNATAKAGAETCRGREWVTIEIAAISPPFGGLYFCDQLQTAPLPALPTRALEICNIGMKPSACTQYEHRMGSGSGIVWRLLP